MLSEAAYYYRMSLGVYKWIRAPRIPDPERVVLDQMAHREHRFLNIVRDTIFTDSGHPYHQMFRLAGCTIQDLERGVLRDGLEKTLASLHRAGVYLSHDEFKGKKPIVRSGQLLPATTKSFVNPLVSGKYESRSGGSRSEGTVTHQNLQSQIYRECYHHFLRSEFDIDRREFIGLMPILPSAWGLGQCIQAARRGSRVERWYSIGGTLRNSGHYRAVTRTLVLLAKSMGANVPFPTYLQPNEFGPAAEFIARKRQEGIACWVRGIASPCVRVAAAALEKGLDIRGTVFSVGGEALTDAKRKTVESTGAEIFPRYNIHEIGFVGQACRQMNGGNSVHLHRDAVAVISYRRAAPLTDVEVDSLLFTTLLPSTPRILINAEMDDAGMIGKTSCGCAYHKAGFTDQISGIYSYGKMTGQGITLAGDDVLHILEDVLPRRFGGAPGDYQLVEQETPHQTRILLRISPRTGVRSATAVQEGFFEELRKIYGGSLTNRQWQHSKALQAVLEEPYVTAAGKVLPLHLLGHGTGNSHEP